MGNSRSGKKLFNMSLENLVITDNKEVTKLKDVSKDSRVKLKSTPLAKNETI